LLFYRAASALSRAAHGMPDHGEFTFTKIAANSNSLNEIFSPSDSRS
jgi:hypothetical protein